MNKPDFVEMKKLLIACLLAFLPLLVAGQQVVFTLLHTSDEHSMLMPAPLVDYHGAKANPALGGYARLATLVSRIKAEKEEGEVLLFSSGDILGGSPFAWLILNQQAAEIELMKKIGYDAIAIGNHEFDYGADILASFYRLGGYPEAASQNPVLSANIEIPDNHPMGKLGILPSKIFDLKGGVKLGVFSLLGKDAVSVAPYAPPITFAEQHQVAGQMVQQLKSKGADIILVLTHSGVEEDINLANDIEGIDIILGGHDHYTSPEPLETNNTIILHSGHYLQRLGQLDFSYDLSTKQLLLLNEANGVPYHHLLDDRIAEDSIVAALVEDYAVQLNAFLSTISDARFTDFSIPLLNAKYSMERKAYQEHTLGNFLTDAMRIVGAEATGDRVDIAIQANGVIRENVVPGVMDWSKGKVSLMDLATVSGLGLGPDSLPGYPLVSVYLTAQEVLNLLEVAALLPQLLDDKYFLQISGLRMTYDPGHAYWFRVPFVGLPLPAYRAIKKAELFTGEGYQQGDAYELINDDQDRLYHLVTDYYLGSFLPMIGEKLPKLKITLKDKHGETISMDEAIVYRNGKEVKVWQVLAEYAESMPKSDNISNLPDYYQNTGERLIVVDAGLPLWVKPLTLILVGLALLALAIKYIKRRKKSL